MKQPIEPRKEDCCDSGCNPCIFDVYERQLLLFEKYLKEGDISNKEFDLNVLSELEYTQFTVLENEILCKDHQFILFTASSVDKKHKVFWKPGHHILIKYIAENMSCSRAYTPLKHKVKSGLEFSIIVKRYDRGVVSNYLCALKPGQETLWRGPYGSYEITPNKFERIIMIAQGTGVAPFYSIIENILGNEDDMTKVIMYYCCQSIDSILLREELYIKRSYWNFEYRIYLSNSSQKIAKKYQEPIIDHKLCSGDLLRLTPYSLKDQILLCGSHQFMDYYSNYLKNEHTSNIITF